MEHEGCASFGQREGATTSSNHIQLQESDAAEKGSRTVDMQRVKRFER